ncbi:MAG: hypothetical protein AAF847_15035, partial [Bacteroidota bacterium]
MVYFIRLRSRQFRGAYFVSERRSPQPDSLPKRGSDEVQKQKTPYKSLILSLMKYKESILESMQ